MKRHFFSASALVLMILFAFGSVDTSNVNTGGSSSPPSGSGAEGPEDSGAGKSGDTAGDSSLGKKNERDPVVFDVPSLIGKSIDAIRTILGKPQDREPEPTKLQLRLGVDVWDNLFVRNRNQDEQELLVTFNPRTRQVEDFFLVGDDKTTLMQEANVSEGSRAYRIEPVKAINDPSEITGIKIIPTRAGVAQAARAEAEQEVQRAAAMEAAKWRTWTTADGKYKVEAKLVMLIGGTVTLEKKDGATVDVKLSILCLEDQDFVKQRKSTKPAKEN